MVHDDSRTLKFIKNVLGSAFLQIVTVVTGFISPRLMINAFGSEINGITASILQFVSYISLVEAGLNSAAVFALYKPLASKDRQKLAEVSSAIRVMYVRTGIYFAILAVALAIVFPLISHTDALNRLELSLLVLIISSQSAINFFILAKYRTLLTADQLGYFISYSSALQLIVNLGIIYGTIRLGWGVIAVRSAAILALVVTSAVLALIIRWKYANLNFHAKPDMAALSTRKDALFLQIMGVVTNGAPVVFMTMLLDFKQVSVYSIYAMIAGSVTTCIAVFTSGLGSAFGDIYALDDKALLEKTAREFRTAYYILITIIYSTMLCTLMPFIRLYTKTFTDVNYDCPLLGILITLNGLLFNFKAPHGMFIFSQGKFSLIRRQTVIQAVLIIAGCWFATKYYGLSGCMAVLCIANLYMLAELLWLAPRHLVRMSVWNNILQMLLSLAVCTGMFGFSLWIRWRPRTFAEWILYAGVIGAISMLISPAVFAVFDLDPIISVWRRIISHLLVKRGRAHFA